MASVDAIYYRDSAQIPLSRQLMKKAREAMYSLFVDELQSNADTTILDLGVSDEETDESNMLEKLHPFPAKITCAGIGDGRRALNAYPGIGYVKIIPGQPLPFEDKSFDIVCSNAVLEHVGGPQQRRLFLEEALRVGRAVFITVPNRWFPVEHHTGIPLAHFSKGLFRSTLQRTHLTYWSNPGNLDFLDKRLLLREWPGSTAPKVVYTGLRLGPFSSNLALIAK
jgi:SAM-dependent methyltransferase